MKCRLPPSPPYVITFTDQCTKFNNHPPLWVISMECINSLMGSAITMRGKICSVVSQSTEQRLDLVQAQGPLYTLMSNPIGTN